MWIFSVCLLLVACRDQLQPLRASLEGPQAKVHLRLTLPTPKGVPFKTVALNDGRNDTVIGQVDVTLKASGQSDWKPFNAPVPVNGLNWDTSFAAPLGRNMVLVVQGLTQAGQPIPGSRLSGTFSALVNQGSVDVDVNRLTTPVGKAIEQLIDRANDTQDPDRQKARDLLLSYDGAGLQGFVNGLMGATGDRLSDLAKLSNNQLSRHPALINASALAHYLWTNGTTPTNKLFVKDANNLGVELSPGTISGSLQGMLPSGSGTLLVDDPLSQPVAVTSATSSFNIPNVAPGNWTLKLISQGHTVEMDPYQGSGPPPSDRAIVMASGGSLTGQGFKLTGLPASLLAVSPSRGPKSADLNHQAMVTITGSMFGPSQAGAKVVFVDSSGVAFDANGIQTWQDDRIVVAVPANLDTSAAYTVRVSKPTMQPGTYLTSTDNVTYQVGSWQKLFATPIPGLTALSPMGLDAVSGPTANLLALSGNFHTLFPPTVINLGLLTNLPTPLSGPSDSGVGSSGAWAADADGSSVRVYADNDPASGTQALKARIYALNGSAFSSPITLVSGISGFNVQAPRAVFTGSQQLLVAYTLKSIIAGSSVPDRVYLARFGLGGGTLTPIGTAIRVDQYPDANGYTPRNLARLACKSDRCAVTWDDQRAGGGAVYLRPFNLEGQPLANEKLAFSGETAMGLAVAKNGDIAVSSNRNLTVYNSSLSQRATMSAYSYSSCTNPVDNNVMNMPELLFNRDDDLIVLAKYYTGCLGGGQKSHLLQLNAVDHDLQPHPLYPYLTWYSRTTPGYSIVMVSNMAEQSDGTVSLIVSQSYDNQTLLAQAGWK